MAQRVRTKVAVAEPNQTLPATPLDEWGGQDDQGVEQEYGHCHVSMVSAFPGDEDTPLEEENGERLGDLDDA